MKNTQRYIFVDDGYPEAEEYETNFIGWDTELPKSFEQALNEAGSIMRKRRNETRRTMSSIFFGRFSKNSSEEELALS